MSEERTRGVRKMREGTVVSNRMDKTVVVSVTTTGRHTLYSKAVRRAKKFYAHDENNECRIGDRVMITETRPMSKLKRWRVSQVLEKARE